MSFVVFTRFLNFWHLALSITPPRYVSRGGGCVQLFFKTVQYSFSWRKYRLYCPLRSRVANPALLLADCYLVDYTYVYIIYIYIFYVCEAWSLSIQNDKAFDGVCTRVPRMALTVPWEDHVRNTELYDDPLRLFDKISHVEKHVTSNCGSLFKADGTAEEVAQTT